MADLVLVRHTETARDPTRHPSQWSLTDDGLSRLARLATLLGNRGLCRIFSSPEAKATGTARVLSEALGLPVAITKDFEEQRNSDARWLSRAEFERLVRERSTPRSTAASATSRLRRPRRASRRPSAPCPTAATPP